MKIYLKILCSFTIVTSVAYAALPEPPAEAKIVLDAHVDELKKLVAEWSADKELCYRKVLRPEWLPEYYIKYDIRRVGNARRVQDVISRNNLDLIFVPKKYAYHIPKSPREICSEYYLVIAEGVKVRTTDRVTTMPSEWRDLKKFIATPGRIPSFYVQDGITAINRNRNLITNRAQLEQIVNLMQSVPYRDFNGHNHIIGTDGRIAIIDTDSKAVPPESSIYMRMVEGMSNCLSWLLVGEKIFNDEEIAYKDCYQCCTSYLSQDVQRKRRIGQAIKRCFVWGVLASAAWVSGVIPRDSLLGEGICGLGDYFSRSGARGHEYVSSFCRRYAAQYRA